MNLSIIKAVYLDFNITKIDETYCSVSIKLKDNDNIKICFILRISESIFPIKCIDLTMLNSNSRITSNDDEGYCDLSQVACLFEPDFFHRIDRRYGKSFHL